MLDANDTDQEPIAEPYVLELSKAILGDKKGKHIQAALHLLYPWTRFIRADQAQALLAKVGAHRDRLTGTRKGKAVETSDRIKRTIGDLALRGNDASTALAHLDLFLDLGIRKSLVQLLRSSRQTRSRGGDESDPRISTGTISRLFAAEDTESSALLVELVLTYPAIASAVANDLLTSGNGQQPHALPIAAALIDLPCAAELPDGYAQLAVSALATELDTAETDKPAAIDVLLYLAQRDAAVTSVNLAIQGITAFDRSVAELLGGLSSTPGLETKGLMSLALRYAVEVCADPTSLSSGPLDNLGILGRSVRQISRHARC